MLILKKCIFSKLDDFCKFLNTQHTFFVSLVDVSLAEIASSSHSHDKLTAIKALSNVVLLLNQTLPLE